MASLKYFLKEPDSKKKSLIHLIFQYGYFETDPVTGRKKYKFLKMSSGEKIEPGFWNQEKCRARETRAFPQYPEFNSRLENLENAVFNTYRRLINDGKFPTPSQLKEEIKNETNKRKVDVTGNSGNVGFFDFFRQFIEECTNGLRLTSKGKHYRPVTIMGYVTTLKHLEDFQRSRGERIDYESITMDFYNELVNWFYKKDMAKNTLGKHIKNLIVVMREAVDRGVTKNDAFKNKKFKVLEEETETIYLCNDELERMLALDLSKKPGLELARDSFLLDCYIGLRIADMKNLRKDHIIEVQGVKMIKIKLQKTEAPVMIPLNRHALKILEKYDYEIGRLTEKDNNGIIKTVGKLAGIDEDITTSITRGGQRVETTVKKYKKITNHTARRSFATNLYLAGVPTLAIMQMTGHKTERSFLKYIRVTPEENALKISQHPYFQ